MERLCKMNLKNWVVRI